MSIFKGRWVLPFIIIAYLSLHGLETQQQSVFDQPVDIVYSWVNGSDPELLAIKNSYLGQERIKRKDACGVDGCTDNRFNDNQELRYSLRSIWKYAPFVHHIYIVTMNQRPEWLADHPMITVIDHREIFKNLNNLPTFNSHAIESNLHRIPGLKEHFIYFNDDVFLGSPVTPAHFFTPTGKIKVLFSKSFSSSEPLKPEEQSNPHANTVYRNAWRNTNAFLDAHFKKEPRYRLCHAPFAMRQSFMTMAEHRFPSVFETNSSHRFRSNSDYNVINGFLQYFLVYHKKVKPGSLSNRMISLQGDNFIERTIEAFERLKNSPLQAFCIQDVMTGESQQTKELLHAFLTSYYPEPAPWEKS